MCVLDGGWQFPDEKSGASKWKAKAVIRQRAPHPRGIIWKAEQPSVSQSRRSCEDFCDWKPAERLDIDELIQALTDVIEALPDDEDIISMVGPVPRINLSLSLSLHSSVSMASSLSLLHLSYFLFPFPFPYMYSTTIL